MIKMTKKNENKKRRVGRPRGGKHSEAIRAYWRKASKAYYNRKKGREEARKTEPVLIRSPADVIFDKLKRKKKSEK